MRRNFFFLSRRRGILITLSYVAIYFAISWVIKLFIDYISDYDDTILNQDLKAYNTNTNNIYGQLYTLRLSSRYANNKTFIRTITTDISLILRNRNAIIIHDIGPCFWVAQGISVHAKSGRRIS